MFGAAHSSLLRIYKDVCHQLISHFCDPTFTHALPSRFNSSRATHALLYPSHAQTVGEPAPLLRGIVLQQLQELKEDQHVTTEVNDNDSDSIEEDRDGAEGVDAAV